MAIYRKGADPDALDAASGRLALHAKDCATVRTEVAAALRSLDGSWGGPDFDSFKARWPTADSTLETMGHDLDNLSQRLRTNAAAQRGTSNLGPDGGPGPGPADGPGSGGGTTQGHTTPRPQRHWWDEALDGLQDAGAWTYNHTVVPTVDGLANVGQAIIEHPEDLAGLLLGAGMISLGTGGEVGGVALDATGVGAVAGVPINIASAGLIAAGAGVMAMSGGDLVSNAAQNDNQVLDEAKGSERPSPGDSIADDARPDAAGEGWKGRVSENGKGEVWQKPESAGAPPGSPKNADSVRIMEGTDRYPDGYVRFYNEHGQPVDVNGKPGPAKSPDTHFPIRPDGSYDVPQGWNP